MSEMIERVARAIYRSQNARESKIRIKLSADERWRDYAGAARAAIEAMREPTEAMDNAGLDSPDATYCDRCMQLGKTGHQHPGSIWRAMIDEALK